MLEAMRVEATAMRSTKDTAPVVEFGIVPDVFVSECIRVETIGGVSRIVFAVERLNCDEKAEKLISVSLVMEHHVAAAAGQMMQMAGSERNLNYRKGPPLAAVTSDD
jgi:hypothetical protein